jgi:hypothetical protein
MSFPFGKYWVLILAGIAIILLSLTSVLAVQFQISFTETNGLTVWLSKLFNDWVAPLAVPLSVSAATLIIFSAFMIFRDIRGKRRRKVSERIRTWAGDTIMLLVAPISGESPALQVEGLKAKFQAVKADGLNALVDSEQVSRELNGRVWMAVTSILKFSDAFSKGDTTFDFRGELGTLLEKLQDVIDCTSNE